MGMHTEEESWALAGPRSATVSRWLAVVVLLTGLYVTVRESTLYGNPNPVLTAGTLPVFAACVAFHAILYLIEPFAAARERALRLLFAIQAAAIVAIGIMSEQEPIVLLLTIGLAAAAVARRGDHWGQTLIYGSAAALFGVTVGLIAGPRSAVLAGLFLATVGLLVYAASRARAAAGRARVDRLLHGLDEAHRELARYAESANQAARDLERERIAREWHDTLAQGLVGLTLQLEAAESHLARAGTDRAREIIRQAMTRARGALAEARGAIHDLRSSPDDAVDFPAVLAREVHRFRDATSVPCDMELALDDPVPGEVREHALKAVREALGNVARHAKASRVSVSVTQAHGGLTIEVADDGIGFDPDAAQPGVGHYGLVGLAERARITGGTLGIDTGVGRGTRLRVRLGSGGDHGE